MSSTGSTNKRQSTNSGRSTMGRNAKTIIGITSLLENGLSAVERYLRDEPRRGPSDIKGLSDTYCGASLQLLAAERSNDFDTFRSCLAIMTQCIRSDLKLLESHVTSGQEDTNIRLIGLGINALSNLCGSIDPKGDTIGKEISTAAEILRCAVVANGAPLVKKDAERYRVKASDYMSQVNQLRSQSSLDQEYIKALQEQNKALELQNSTCQKEADKWWLRYQSSSPSQEVIGDEGTGSGTAIPWATVGWLAYTALGTLAINSVVSSWWKGDTPCSST